MLLHCFYITRAIPSRDAKRIRRGYLRASLILEALAERSSQASPDRLRLNQQAYQTCQQSNVDDIVNPTKRNDGGS